MDVKVFDVMLELNETRFLVQYEACEGKCIPDENACNLKQKCSHSNCECK